MTVTTTTIVSKVLVLCGMYTVYFRAWLRHGCQNVTTTTTTTATMTVISTTVSTSESN